MTVILPIIISLSLFLSILVFFKKGKTYSDYLLAGWLIFTALHMTILYLLFYNAQNNYPFPNLIGIDISLVAVHPIWIFIYILSFIRPINKDLRILWHSMPIIVLNLVLVKTYYLRSENEKIQTYESALNGVGYIDKNLELSVFLVISVALGYLIASYWLLKKHVKNVKSLYSTIEGVDLKWLRVLLHSIAIVFIVNAISELTRNYLHLIPADISIYIGLCFIMLGIAYMGFHGLRQTKIFTNDESVAQAVKGEKSNSEDISLQANKNISEEIFNTDYEKLVHFMMNNKPYQDTSLNIVILANQMGLKTRYLSQLINQKSGKNFFDFINSFRISEFKKRIRKPENRNYTLLSIAYDCGFNSKATFNRVFKTQTGYTPSEYFNNQELS